MAVLVASTSGDDVDNDGGDGGGVHNIQVVMKLVMVPAVLSTIAGDGAGGPSCVISAENIPGKIAPCS